MEQTQDREVITTDCCIAGGGPAGIMLGYILARAGIRVVVLEKWPDFFRDFRGDTIHPSTMEVLHELGLLESFLQLPHNEMEQMVGHVGSSEIVLADLTRLSVRTPFIAFIPQWDFLTFIAQQAKQFPNFRLLMETEAIELIQEEGAVTGVRAHNKERAFEIRAPLTIGADGRHSITRQKANLIVEDLGAPIDVLWFRLQRIDDGTKQSLGYINYGKILVTLDRDSYWQCAYIIHKGEFEAIKARGIEQFKADIVSLVPSFSNAVHELHNFDDVKFLSVTVDHLRQWYTNGLICIGDAAHAMSPLGGIGINLAIQDAVAAANILVPAFRNGGPTSADLHAIQKRRAGAALLTQRLQVFAHAHFLEPLLRSRKEMRPSFLLKLFNVFPFLRWIPARIIGIGFKPEHCTVTF